MKKLLYILIAAAAALTAAACNREAAIDDALMGEMVEATFGVDFAQAQTRAVADGSTATRLVVGVYDKDLGFVESLSAKPDDADYKEAFQELKATYTTRLVKGHSYDLVFLAIAPDGGAYTIDLAKGTLTVKTSGPSNDESRDAFYQKVSIDQVAGAINQAVTLERPFAQLNVVTTKKDYEDAVTAQVKFAKSGLKVKAPSVLNLLDGEAGTPAEYDLSAAPMTETTPGYDPYKSNGDVWLLTDYLLVGQSEILDVTVSLFSEGSNDVLFEHFIPSVPFKRNYRTTIYGQILTTDGQFTLTINPMCGGDETPVAIDENRPQIKMADSTMPVPGSKIEVKVGDKLNFKAIHPIETIIPTYISSDESVGTIDAEGAFEAVGEGSTTITIRFPEVKDGKAVEPTKSDPEKDYAALDLTYTVNVVSDTPAEVEATITASDVTVEEGKTISIGATTNSTAAITYAVADETIATVSDAGVVTGVKAGQTTITLSVEAVEGKFTAAEKTINVTVTAAQVTPPPGDGITIDGNFDDWANVDAIAGTGAITVMKVTSDDTQYFFYLEADKSQLITDTSHDYANYFTLCLDNGDGQGEKTVSYWNNAQYDKHFQLWLMQQGVPNLITWSVDGFDHKEAVDGNVVQYEFCINRSANAVFSGNTLRVGAYVDGLFVDGEEWLGSGDVVGFAPASDQDMAVIGGGDVPQGPVQATITAADVTVTEGKTASIGATTNSTATITYAVADASIATVTDAGVVTGVKAGKTTIILSVAAVEDQFTAAEKTINVTVNAASSGTNGIVIDGSFDDWDDIEGTVNEEGVYKALKATNDDNYFYIYSMRNKKRGNELWGENAGYYYYDFDLDNNPETGENAEGNHGSFEAYMYLYLFGGTPDAPAFWENPEGSGAGCTIDNIICKGYCDSNTSEEGLIETEVRIPRANLPAVSKGQTITITSWGNKDANLTSVTITIK